MANDVPNNGRALQDSPWWMRAMAYFGAPTAITLVLLWGLWQIWNTSMMTHASLLAAHNAESYQQHVTAMMAIDQHAKAASKTFDQLMYFSQLLCERFNDAKKPQPSCVYPGGKD